MQAELPQSQLVIYKTQSGDTKIDVRFDGPTVWLTQLALAELFQTSKQNISQHIQNIFEEGELSADSVVKDFLTTASDGKNYHTNYYNLDLIISVGYRTKSTVATAFRQWATARLSEYIVKGFVLDDERLKNPDVPFDYFEELTRRIADIRTSEKRFYRKITDIYSTSVDYDPKSEGSVLFFKTVQNKVHFAITGHTAAEIVVNRIDENKAALGLTNKRGLTPTKDEVLIAKNYLTETELLELNNLVEQYLLFAEGQAMRRVPMTMQDWMDKLHGFLQINERNVLEHAGKISHELMKEIAEQKFVTFKQNESQKNVNFDEKIQAILDNVKTKKSKK